MKFDILNRYTGKVQFTADVDCSESEATSVKIGLAVKWAIKSGANLSRAYLSRADLSRANLFDANLFGANLSRANLFGADLSRANLSGADLSRANLSGANLFGASGINVCTFGGVGKTMRSCFAIQIKDEIQVVIGCFRGTEKEAVAAIKEKYGKEGKAYIGIVKAACAVVKERMK